MTSKTSMTRSLTVSSTGRRLVGALSTAAAVAVVGVTAVPAGTAMAAGIHRGPVHLADVPAVGPATVPVGAPALGAAVYRHDGTRFVRV